MKYRIIGSVAQYHWFSDSRVPGDIDLLTPAKISGNVGGVAVVDTQWHELAGELIALNKDLVFLDPDLLFTLKVSHAQWNIHWEKTMMDIYFLKGKGCQLNVELLKRLQTMWEGVHGKKHVNMSKSMDVFFNDAVVRKYDHEDLHRRVAFYDAPLHERLRRDHSTAWCSVDLFNNLSVEEQMETVLEEMMATAIERSRLHRDSTRIELRAAMGRAHKQLVISMTKGWFANFLILNRFELLIERKEKWITQLTRALKSLT